MKKFIFFRNDRLGDFLILTNIIKKIKEKYRDSHITVIASPYNYKFIKEYNVINKVYLYNKNNSLLSKIFLINHLIYFYFLINYNY